MLELRCVGLYACLQMVGVGVNWYFRDPWNRFDFALVVLSACTVTLDIANDEHICDDKEHHPQVNFPGLSILRVCAFLSPNGRPELKIRNQKLETLCFAEHGTRNRELHFLNPEHLILHPKPS